MKSETTHNMDGSLVSKVCRFHTCFILFFYYLATCFWRFGCSSRIIGCIFL